MTTKGAGAAASCPTPCDNSTAKVQTIPGTAKDCGDILSKPIDIAKVVKAHSRCQQQLAMPREIPREMLRAGETGCPTVLSVPPQKSGTVGQQRDTENRIMLFEGKTANDTVREAAMRPDPRPLYPGIWYENELCCLFADTNIGKSILAVQMAEKIAETDTVLYFDFELSDKQFQLRYTSPDGHDRHIFPDNLWRMFINQEAVGRDMENVIIAEIERAADARQSRVIIIDNLTWLAADSEKGVDATLLMRELMRLKLARGWSALVIAHTPKRDESRPLAVNDLAGSRRLANFFDGITAIGRSAQDPSIRYLKQLKVRHDHRLCENPDCVPLYTIEREDYALRFVRQGDAPERSLLKQPTEKDDKELRDRVSELASLGRSQRDIGRELGVSAMKVNRLLKQARQ